VPFGDGHFAAREQHSRRERSAAAARGSRCGPAPLPSRPHARVARFQLLGVVSARSALHSISSQTTRPGWRRGPAPSRAAATRRRGGTVGVPVARPLAISISLMCAVTRCGRSATGRPVRPRRTARTDACVRRPPPRRYSSASCMRNIGCPGARRRRRSGASPRRASRRVRCTAPRSRAGRLRAAERGRRRRLARGGAEDLGRGCGNSGCLAATGRGALWAAGGRTERLAPNRGSQNYAQ